jgi:hypothetical protein
MDWVAPPTGPLRRARAPGRWAVSRRATSRVARPVPQQAGRRLGLRVGTPGDRGPGTPAPPHGAVVVWWVGVSASVVLGGCLTRLRERARARRRRPARGMTAGAPGQAVRRCPTQRADRCAQDVETPSSGPSYLDDVLLSFDRLRARWRQVLRRGSAPSRPQTRRAPPDWSAPSYPSDSVTNGVHRCNTAKPSQRVTHQVGTRLDTTLRDSTMTDVTPLSVITPGGR